MKTISKRRWPLKYKTLKRLRTRAFMLFQNHHTQAQVAKQLKVSRQTASRWFSIWEQPRSKGRISHPQLGRRPKLDETLCKELQWVLLAGAKVHGFPTDFWTQDRVKSVIQQKWKIEYHPRHIGRLLNSIGWSYQKLPNRAFKEGNRRVMRWARYRYWSREKKRLKLQAPIHEPESNKVNLSKETMAKLIKRYGLKINP